MKKSSETIRFAVIGAGRGRSFINAAKSADTNIQLVAVCDRNPEALAAWKDDSGIRTFENYEDVLADKEIDAVCIATPVPMHAQQAIQALNAGKHVLSEVTATYTVEEGWDLIAAVEKTGLTYMMAENYCFMEPVLQVQNMVEQGVFGDLIYASGSYIHDCRNLFFNKAEDLTWRGNIRQSLIGNSYPTHSLGPVARWLGINREDRMVSTASWHSRGVASADYARRNLPNHPEYGVEGVWNHPDTVTTSIRTEKEILIDLRVDWSSPRPHNGTRYELQGTRAAFTWPEGMGKVMPLVWIQDRSPTNKLGISTDWEPLYYYRSEYQHPLWREHRKAALDAGHNGGDFFVLREFSGAISERRAPMIDVYDAVAWSSITPLSQISIAQGNASVAVPDFKAKRP